MNYLVMETHPAYAVVLDEEGRFLKTANLGYQVGQVVEQVVELRCPPKRRPPLRAIAGGLALAACLCLFFFGVWQPNFLPYGRLQIQINPEVELEVSRNGRVLSLEGRNEEGEALAEGLRFYGRDSGEMVRQLVERAIGMGWLPAGGEVSIRALGGSEDWQVREQGALQAQLESEFGEAIRVSVGEEQAAPPAAQPTLPASEPALPAAEPAPPASSDAEPRPPVVQDDDDEDDDDDDEDDGRDGDDDEEDDEDDD